MTFKTLIVATAFGCGAFAPSLPALAKVITTEIYLNDVPFVTGGALMGSFGLSWNPATGKLGPDPVQHPFSFVTTTGLAQNGSTTMTGFAHENADASIVLNGHGDMITVTNPPNPGAAGRENVLYVTFEHPLIDLVDGTIGSDPIELEATPYPTGTQLPVSGECARASGSLCTLSTRRFLDAGVAVVPEPSTWLLLSSGFLALGALGAVGRQRRVRAA